MWLAGLAGAFQGQLAHACVGACEQQGWRRRRQEHLDGDRHVGEIRARAGIGVEVAMQRVHSRDLEWARRAGCGEDEQGGGARDGEEGAEQDMLDKFNSKSVSLWSWNCKRAGREELERWGGRWKDSIVCLQGTGRTYVACKGERGLCQWRTSTHDVFEHRVAKKHVQGGQSEGVAVMLPVGMRRVVRQVWHCLLYTSPSPRD